ncbi:hypothetical protein [Aquimarina spongiae]|uniref:Uncharacterized protein n=1 Tax=Aquimarina spongiae TaxID=570521 RepID=A0A1M6ICP9_9FLAO|nr:hypothetical protein [Aquimarina spongiae]SHJ32214.1 hypothetical protein SAMN04488508_107264 [Aquimarina spongiae]
MKHRNNNSLKKWGVKELNKSALAMVFGGTATTPPKEDEIVEFKQGNDRVVRKKPGRTTY